MAPSYFQMSNYVSVINHKITLYHKFVKFLAGVSISLNVTFDVCDQKYVNKIVLGKIHVDLEVNTECLSWQCAFKSWPKLSQTSSGFGWSRAINVVLAIGSCRRWSARRRFFNLKGTFWKENSEFFFEQSLRNILKKWTAALKGKLNFHRLKLIKSYFLKVMLLVFSYIDF